MEELIKIKEENGQQLVSARELYDFLGATERFSSWFERQKSYGLEENKDYSGCKVFNTLANQTLDDYALTLDCAKEISMLQRSDKGKQARQYFIDCEKKLRQVTHQLDFKDPNVVLQLAQNWANEEKRRKEAEKIIEIQAPKVAFAEAIVGSKNSILIGELSTLLKQNGINIGQNRLFEWLRNNGYLCRAGERYNLPTQLSLELKIMEIKKGSYSANDTLKNCSTPKITPKGIDYFIGKFLIKNNFTAETKVLTEASKYNTMNKDLITKEEAYKQYGEETIKRWKKENKLTTICEEGIELYSESKMEAIFTDETLQMQNIRIDAIY